MWPIPTLQNEIVTFSFSETSLFCCWMQKTDNEAVIVKAYQKHLFNHNELTNIILFNPTRIKNIITTFLSQYQQNNAFVVFGLEGASIVEEYITFAMSTPQREDFGISSSSNFLWKYYYLYQNQDGQNVFYIYKIPQFLLMQYKLLAIAARCNIITITTHSAAFFSCYKNIVGNTFRQSQFALDMQNNNNNPDRLIPFSILQKKLINPAYTCIIEEQRFFAISYGLFSNQGLMT